MAKVPLLRRPKPALPSKYIKSTRAAAVKSRATFSTHPPKRVTKPLWKTPYASRAVITARPPPRVYPQPHPMVARNPVPSKLPKTQPTSVPRRPLLAFPCSYLIFSAIMLSMWWISFTLLVTTGSTLHAYRNISFPSYQLDFTFIPLRIETGPDPVAPTPTPSSAPSLILPPDPPTDASILDTLLINYQSAFHIRDEFVFHSEHPSSV